MGNGYMNLYTDIKSFRGDNVDLRGIDVVSFKSGIDNELNRMCLLGLENEAQVIRLMYLNGMMLKEAAASFGYSSTWVCIKRRAALNHLSKQRVVDRIEGRATVDAQIDSFYDVDNINIPLRIINNLHRVGIETFNDLDNISDESLSAARGLSRGIVKTIRKAVAECDFV